MHYTLTDITIPRTRPTEKKEFAMVEEDVFAKAPFKLPPKKGNGNGDLSTHTTAALKEKRHLHRYENVPPLADKRPHIMADQDKLPPRPPKSQDLFGLVPFTVLTSPPSTVRKFGTEVIRPSHVASGAIVRAGMDYRDDSCDSVTDIVGDEAGVSNLSFEDIGPEEASWNVN